MLKVRATAPGGWLALAVPGVTLLVESRTDAPAEPERLLVALRAEEPIPATLAVLTADGFSSMPSFCLLALDGESAHYVVRGEVELELDGPAGAAAASGRGITTWNEQLASGVTGFLMTVAGAEPGGHPLPLVEGAMWADAIVWDETDASPAAPAPQGAAAQLTGAVPASAPATQGTAGRQSTPPPQSAPQPGAPVRQSTPQQPSAPTPEPVEFVSQETLLPTALDGGTLAGHPLSPTPTPTPTTTAGPTIVAAEEDSIPAVPEGTTGYDHLFGVTVMKSVESAAVRPDSGDSDGDDDAEGSAARAAAGAAGTAGRATAPTAGPVGTAPSKLSGAAADDGGGGDHDGLTMMSGDIAELRRRAGAAEPTASAATTASEPPAAPPDEPRFRLDVSDGRSETLDRPVIVGRAPSASKVSGSALPRLLTVGGTDPDISRNHVRFTVEGGTVVITDLNSRNGTVMSLPGRPPQKLREGEPTSALVGTVVDLGGGIRITVTEVGSAARL